MGCNKDVNIDTYISVIDSNSNPIPAKDLVGAYVTVTLGFDISGDLDSAFNTATLTAELAAGQEYKNDYLYFGGERDFYVNTDSKENNKKLKSYKTKLHLPALGITVDGTNTILTTDGGSFDTSEHESGLLPEKEKIMNFQAEAKFVFIVDKNEFINDVARMSKTSAQKQEAESVSEETQASSK